MREKIGGWKKYVHSYDFALSLISWRWVTIQRLRPRTKRDVIVWLAVSASHCDKVWNVFTCEWICGSGFRQNKNLCFAGDHVGEHFSTTLILCVWLKWGSRRIYQGSCWTLRRPLWVLHEVKTGRKEDQGSMKWKPVTATFPLSPQSCMQDFREASVMQGVILFKNDWAEKCWFPWRGIPCRANRPTWLSFVAYAFDLHTRNLCFKKSTPNR